MAIAVIDKWLSGSRDYNAGVLIYKNLGKSKVLLSLFEKGDSYYTRTRLEEELLKLNEGTAEPEQIEQIVKEQKVLFNKYPTEHFPETLQVMIRKKVLLYKEANHLHAQLSIVTDEARSGVAQRLVAVWDEIDTIWKHLDYYHAHGSELPTRKKKEGEEITDPVKLLQRRNTLRTYITKNKNKPHKAEQVQTWTAELDDINKKLNK